MTTLLLIPLLLCPPAAPYAVEAQDAAVAQPAEQAPEIVAENAVRLRKLHLVRPELIPYPLAYEVYC